MNKYILILVVTIIITNSDSIGNHRRLPQLHVGRARVAEDVRVDLDVQVCIYIYIYIYIYIHTYIHT